MISIAATAEVRIESQGAEAESTTERVLREELARLPADVAARDVRVTIGPAAFRAALAQTDNSPLVAVYITSTDFESALSKSERPSHITAVFSNPDPLHQLALARALLGRASLAVFDSPQAHSLAQRVAAHGVHAIPVGANPRIDSLLRVLDPFDALLVLPDPAVLNRSNINHAVRALYQRRKVLIGYSATLTRVGSLASVFVSPEATALQVAQMLEEHARTGVLPKPSFVNDVDVAVNDRLARSLNIALPERSELVKAIRLRGAASEAKP